MTIRREIRFRWLALRRSWYHRRYGIRIEYGGRNGTMMPKLGRGKYVSVRQRGPFLDIRDERTGEVIRLVPYQPNHGVMVELHLPGSDGPAWRSHCDFRAFREMGFGASEAKAAKVPQ
jgi:hypothetical protein